MVTGRTFSALEQQIDTPQSNRRPALESRPIHPFSELEIRAHGPSLVSISPQDRPSNVQKDRCLYVDDTERTMWKFVLLLLLTASLNAFASVVDHPRGFSVLFDALNSCQLTVKGTMENPEMPSTVVSYGKSNSYFIHSSIHTYMSRYLESFRQLRSSGQPLDGNS